MSIDIEKLMHEAEHNLQERERVAARIAEAVERVRSSNGNLMEFKSFLETVKHSV